MRKQMSLPILGIRSLFNVRNKCMFFFLCSNGMFFCSDRCYLLFIIEKSNTSKYIMQDTTITRKTEIHIPLLSSKTAISLSNVAPQLGQVLDFFGISVLQVGQTVVFNFVPLDFSRAPLPKAEALFC